MMMMDFSGIDDERQFDVLKKQIVLLWVCARVCARVCICVSVVKR
jgi:hypothetical protein